MTRSEATSTASPAPQEQIFEHVMAICQGRCLVSAAELGLADVLGHGRFPWTDRLRLSRNLSSVEKAFKDYLEWK